ncbi:MAG: SgcJ/EcaC family oxidoreductase [Sphingomonas sp.]|nr:SgcJ/EcaC family oxidoreductase [Sphingomonas sp.]
MKSLILIAAATLLPTTLCSAALPAAAQVQPSADHAAEEAEIRALAQTWQDSWNKRDAEGLASIMDPRLVFVSVQGPDTPGFGRGGREAFKAGHAAIMKTMFADSVWTNEDVKVVRWLRPDIAVVHVVWRTTGDRVRHVKFGAPRRGMFTWVLEKQAGNWRVVASQNTESMPPLPGQ